MKLDQALEMAEALTLDDEHAISTLGNDGDEVAELLLEEIERLSNKKNMTVNVLSNQKEGGGFDHYVTFGNKAPWKAKDEDVVQCATEEDAHKLKALIDAEST